MNRLCRICDTAERQNKKARKHECTKNYTGSSKSMEPHVAVQFLLDAPSKKYCIGLITSDDDSTMKAWCTHIDSGNPKSKLPKWIYQPKFMADPTHRKRVVASKFYKLANSPVAVSRVTSAIAKRMKKIGVT